MQRFVPPLSQSTVALTPVAQQLAVAPAYQVVSPNLVQSNVLVAPQLATSAVAVQPAVAVGQAAVVKQQLQPVVGQSRLEHVPYQRKVIDYEQQVSTTIVPKERLVQDYYTIEHQVNYIPNVIQEPYIDYVPVQKYKQRVEYNAVESSRAVTQPNYAVQQGNLSTVYGGTRYAGGVYQGVQPAVYGYGSAYNSVYGAPQYLYR